MLDLATATDSKQPLIQAILYLTGSCIACYLFSAIKAEWLSHGV
jgi:hypothetical protein